MRFQRIIQAVHSQPWLITSHGHAAIRALLESRMAQALDFKADRPSVDFFGAPMAKMEIANGIATIPIYGVIGKGLGQMEKTCGAVSVEDIAADVEAAASNPAVSAIFLDFASPGGTVSGVPDLAETITAAAKKKPLMSYTEADMCSGAYWLAAGSTAIYASRSAEVGSIGVYMPWIDQTAAYAAEGIKVDLIKNKEGTYKGAGYPGTSLTDDQRAQFQAQVDQIFQMFAGHILESRSVPMASMRGQTFLGVEAVKAGLVDSIASKSQALADLQSLVA